MINLKTSKIGDKVIATDVTHSLLTLNKKYTISEIIYNNADFDDYNFCVRLKETVLIIYFPYRFKYDLKISRKKKLKQLCQK